MHETLRKIEDQMDTIRTWVLVFVGAGINLIVGYVVLIASFYALIATPVKVLTSNIPQTALVFAILFFLVGILYSVSASIAFKPKRIISPIYTQVLGASFIPILVYYVASSPPAGTQPMSLASGLAAAFFLYLMGLAIFGLAGLGQERVVRKLVGLNGTKEDVASFSLIVDGKLTDVINAIKKPDVREALDLERRNDRKGEHSYVFRTPNYFRKQFFIALMEDADDKTKTWLSTVSYMQTRYWIAKPSSLLEEKREELLKGALKRAGFDPKVDETTSPAKLLAYTQGLDVTESKLLGVKNMSLSSQIIFIGLVLLVAVVTGIWLLGYMTLDTYETFVVLDGLSILVDFLPVLKIEHKEFDLEDFEEVRKQ